MTRRRGGRYTAPSSRLALRFWPKDERLRRPSYDVTDFGERLTRLVDVMVRVMEDEGGIGLAAPQVGRNERVILVQGDDGPEVLVNPLVIPLGPQVRSWEGCLSMPNIWAELERCESCRIDALDMDERPISRMASGREARIVQHEADHLDGVLIADRLSARQHTSLTNIMRESGGLPRISVHLGVEGKVTLGSLPQMR